MANKTKFIINTAVEFFDAVTLHKDDNEVIKEFFEVDEITILTAVHIDGKIIFQHSIPQSEENCLLFYKIPKPNKNSGPSLGILTLEGGMVKSMYNSMARVFSPHAESRSTEYSPELSGILQNLHTSLGSTLGLPQTGIATVRDEINYWKQKSAKSSTKNDRELSQAFCGVLERIDKEMRDLNSTTSHSLEEFLDMVNNMLDELWRLPYQYPGNRMCDVMDVICTRIIEICIENFNTDDVWNINSYSIPNILSYSEDIIDSYIQLCDTLTRLFWPNYVQHPWTSKPHIPKKSQQFKERLSDIRSIRSLYKQVANLLGEEEFDDIFTWDSPFRKIDIFDISLIGQKKWKQEIPEFEQHLERVDEQIAAAIKAQLHIHLSNPRQVIYIFSKYQTLVQRPNVLEALKIEREQFIQSLHILLQDLRKAMSDTNLEPEAGHLSPICNECRWLKVVEHQIVEIENISSVLVGREGYEKIIQTVQELKEETESLLRTNFEIWCGQNVSAVRNEDLRLREDQPVVKFEKEGRQLMRVTFNPKLVSFCQDVREFENLGYNVPAELRTTAAHAAKFMSYARKLQQIATFHNTIGDRMIPCQRPIMLKNAVELSTLVQSETVAWNDEDSVKKYVSSLQNAVSKLSSDNTLLVGYHEQAKRTVLKLMKTDLFTQGQVWKDEMRHLREIIATLESQGYTNLDAFKLHWDHQLYKVLEYQYILGIIDMNHKLPEIQIDLIFKQRQLCFRPSEEEIREKYYTQQRKFLERPVGFRGLSDKSGDLFKVMVENNRQYFVPLFNKAENLFAKLYEFKRLWMPFIALGCVDLDELCSIHLNKWEDWDSNFRACKHFSQQIAKIQNYEEVIDCFVINLVPLRSDIEFMSRRYWDALTSSLRNSILVDVEIIQDFLQSSLQFLKNVPMNEFSVVESGIRYENMTNDLPKIEELLELVKGKDKCLAGWCKERVSSLSVILDQWEQLQPLIENHSAVLQRQVDIMKDHAKGQILNLKNDAEKFLLRWESTMSELEANDDSSLDVFKDRLEYWTSILLKKEKLVEDSKKLNLEFPSDVLIAFEDIEKKINDQSTQWHTYDDYLSELEGIGKEEWSIYRRRPYILTEFLKKWEDSISTSVDIASNRVRLSIERLQKAEPILQQLQSEALTERHWAKIFQMIEKTPKPIQSITFSDILEDLPLLIQSSAQIQNLVKQAASEQIVRQALVELDQWSVTANLKLTFHSDSGGSVVPLIKDYQEVLNKIGDNQSLLQSAKNSASIDTFSDQADLWESRLNTLDSILTNLSQSQRRWVYLEPVFGAGTLRNEEALFKRVDKDFRYVMREIQADPRVISLIKINNISTIVNSLESQLTRCQNNLVSYIMEKRNSFPRFYFLGDDDLLEILGQATKEEIIQKHIRKLFPGCHSLVIENTTSTSLNWIKAIRSTEGDVVHLIRAVEMSGAIEKWLNDLVETIKQTLKEQISECFKRVDKLTEETIQLYPSQVLTTARALYFTRQVEKAIGSMTLSKLAQNLNEEIGIYVSLKNHTVNSLLHTKLRSLLMDLVYYVSIVRSLDKGNVTTQNDWHWQKQIKFYFDGKDPNQVIIRMVHAEFEYSYEYLGNPNKLVNTSLTHKCYLILTQAMAMGLGGNPFGPAGTGKTECVKALGGLMGRLVLVFNCDENVDTEAMSLILTGLAKCGAWGCFDEFNRLRETTLSATSMVIQPIQQALKDKSEHVIIFDKKVNLNHHCGIFVTLNPAGADYGGRQKLPGNIQALFRPIVMQQPEPKEIARVLLFVEGFQQNEEIGSRIVEFFDLCSKMLSSEKHYDWGLRELKTILVGCGGELQHNKKTTTTLEFEIVVQALKSNTMSKLSLKDGFRFGMLLKSVFPEVEVSDAQQSPLLPYIETAYEALALRKCEVQVEKVLQLFEQLVKRMGVVIVGPPGCGKTTIIRILKNALSLYGRTVKSYHISPKSMSRVQLLGNLDPDTRQWSDGVLTMTSVIVNSEPQNVTSWIVCDGDVDPEWIEALNSVLDDNKLLTLPSGWRIQFGNNVNFIFETHDLSNASPATISRMGIVNLNIENLPTSVLINSRLSNLEDAEIMQVYFDEIFQYAFSWLSKETTVTQEYSKSNLALICLKTMNNIVSKDKFCVKLISCLLGYLPSEIHNDFAMAVFEYAKIYLSNPNKSELTYYNEKRDAVEFYESDSSSDSDQVLLKTAQIKTYFDIVKMFLENHVPFLICGPSAAAKSLLIEETVKEFSGLQLVNIHCSTQLSPSYILHVLKQNCLTVSGIKGREYKPKQSRLVLYFKNLDLCYIDSWGTSDVVELLLTLIEKKGFYNESLEWIAVSGLQICGSISQSLLSTKKLSPRFMARMGHIRVKHPSDNDMEIVLTNSLHPILVKFKKSYTTDVVESLMAFFRKVQESFMTRPESTHYHFTPKTLIKLIDGLYNYPEDNFNEALLCEITSIFKDRLANQDDIAIYNDIFRETMRRFLWVEKEKIYFVPKLSLICNFEALGLEDLQDRVQRTIAVCNSELLLIEEPVTKELLDQTAKISRILSRPKSHLVVLGEPGSGYLDALYISASMYQVKVCIPQITRSYGLTEFYNDIKVAMVSAAIDNQIVCMLIEQSLITFQPDVMKPIEAIMEESEIIDLFGEDLDSIANQLKSAAQLEGYQESLSTFFMTRVQKNLHLILVLNPKSPKTNSFFSIYPTFRRNADFLYIRSMSEETILSFPKVSIEAKGDKVPISSYFSEILSSQHKKQPPKRIYQLIQCYYNIYKFYNGNIQKRLQKLQSGVDKLAAAHKVVGELKSSALKQEESLAEKRKMANEALEKISSTMRNANEQKSTMLELRKKTEEDSERLKERQKAIQIELSEVEPILKEASAAVGQIKSEALSEIRSLRAPPAVVRDILEGVLLLMGINDTTWTSMKSFLGRRGVKEDILSLDPSRIREKDCKAVDELLRNKADSFEIKNAKRASAAAAPLATWVKACVRYSKVAQSIKPLEAEQRKLQGNLYEAENEMKSLVTGLDTVDTRVKELSNQLNVYTQEAAVLEIKLEESRNTLKSAEILVQKLSSEFHNWSNQLEEGKSSYKTLDNKCLFISTSINYLSSLSYKERLEVLNKLTDSVRIPEFDILKNIISERDQIIWESMGLSRDVQVQENAALLSKMMELPFNSYPIPLLIDPTGTASKWLPEYIRSKNVPLEFISQNNERLTYNLELAIRFGKAFIVQDCQDLRPPLIDLIKGRIFMNNKKMIDIGNKLVDLNDNFKIVLISKSEKINIAEESMAYLTPIKFTTTLIGLTDQLISKTILHKKPELEQKRIELLQTEGGLLQKKIDMEDNLLEELSNSQGDVLKNEKLLETLNEVKESSLKIDKSLKESSNIKSTLEEEYKQYRDICSKAASLYIGVNKKYELSSIVFSNLYLQSLEMNLDDLESYKSFVKSVFLYLCRSTAKEEHVTLGTFICKNAFTDQIPPKEWELFVTNFMVTRDGESNYSIPSWIHKDHISKLMALISQIPSLEDALKLDDEHIWNDFVTNKKNDKIPVKLSHFHNVLICLIFRPDLMINYIQKMINGLLGMNIEAIIQPTIEQLAEEGGNSKPILLVTEPENDPSDEIRSLAVKKLGSAENFLEISIGKGMEKTLLDTLRKFSSSSKWICLKNVHLMPHWLVDLDREIEMLKKAENFKIWLICEHTRNFPESVTYKFVNVLFEYPDGIKNKSKRLIQQNYGGSLNKMVKDARSAKLNILLFILTSALQERRKYIPQGWSQKYELGNADLKAAQSILVWLESSFNSSKVDWSVLRNLCHAVAYGGRMNNSRDLDVLKKYLAVFFNNESLSNKWSPMDMGVNIPTTGNIQEYLNTIQKFPDVDKPETFGLSPQSNITRDLEQGRQLIAVLRAEYFRSNDVEKLEKRVRPILSLWKKLAAKSSIPETHEMLEEVDNSTPWKTFLISEMSTAGKCYNEIHKTLAQMHLMLKTYKTTELQDDPIFHALSDNQVPISWKKIWSGPKSATQYISLVVSKGHEAEKRYKEGIVKPMEFVEEIALETIFHPKTLLSSLKLANAQKIGKSTADLNLHSDTVKLDSTGSITVKLSSLEIDGAAFDDNGRVVLTAGTSISPDFYVTFIESSSKMEYPSSVTYLPLYSNPSRESMVCNLKVSTKENKDRILLSGAALIIPDLIN